MCEKDENIKPIKPALTFEEQLKKIEERGCIIADENWATDVLKQINYYRLTAYFLPYKDHNEKCLEGTTFNNVYQTYEFDRKLRHLLYSAIEEIEIMLRAQLSYYHAHKYGALGYEREENFNKHHNHEVFMRKIQEDINRNKNKPAVRHHIDSYGGKFPVWVIIELFTVSQLSFFYSDMQRVDMKKIAKELYNTTDKNLSNWLKCFTELRN
ncbi:MAG: Abi family protein [Clostridiales bacterium]|nr:Abi family protein [Clostridiales bacterium]